MFAEMLDDVKRSVQVNLPMLSAETLNKLIQKFESDGMESLADCGLVTEFDLMDVLKPTQIQKLLVQWKSGNKI